jgi:hypothetical protein
MQFACQEERHSVPLAFVIYDACFQQRKRETGYNRDGIFVSQELKWPTGKLENTEPAIIS